MQAGHFIGGRRSNNLFDIRGIRVQCYSCNVGKHGNPIVYFQNMEKEVGREVIDELIAQDRQNKQFTPAELQVLLIHYKQLNSKP